MSKLMLAVATELVMELARSMEAAHGHISLGTICLSSLAPSMQAWRALA